MTTLIACGIFKDELEYALDRKNDVQIQWLSAALHASPDRMKTEIEQRMAEVCTDEKVGPVHLIFGTGCHPDMGEMASACQGCLPWAKNCIHAVIGPERTKTLEDRGAMIITPGWMSAWPDIMAGLGWDEVDVRINLGRYDRIVLLDTGLVPIEDEAVLEFYDLAQVPVEIEPADPDYFREKVAKVLEGTGLV